MLPGTPAPTAPCPVTTPPSAPPAAGEDEAGPALHALRAASARVAEIGPDTTAPGGGDDADDGALDRAFDAAEHATRFEELHEALAAVLAELDRT